MQTLLTGREPQDIRAHGIPDDCFIPAKVQTLISQMMAPDPAQRPLSLRSTRDSMRKLQQRYPTPTPFSWWFFLWLCLAMGLEPFFVPKDVPGLPLALPLLAIVLMGYHLFKVRRTLFTGKLSGKDFRLIVEKSMDKACQWTAGIWGLSNCSLIQVAVMPLFEPIMLIKIVLYVVISFASLILIPLASSRLLKKTRIVNSS